MDLRNEIRSRCRQLEPSDGQVLHATFAGDKRPNADVENLVLNYIDSFAASGRNGIRFEYGAAVPSAPDETRYAFGYRYALASRTATFSDWEPVRKLASFDWITLKGFDGEKKQAKVRLEVSRALVRGEVEVFESALPGTPFAVRVQLRPPHQRTPVWGNLVKEVFDGVICAFQAHIDIGGLDAVVARLATYLPAGIDEIRRLLIDQHRAVLGAVPQLIRVYRSGVKWDPADHWCVAGELLAAERDAPTGLGWAIKGDIRRARTSTVSWRLASALAERGQYLISCVADLGSNLVLTIDCENIRVQPGSGDLDARADVDLNASCLNV